MLGAPIASIFFSTAYGFIYDKLGNYKFVLMFLIFMLVVGLISIWIAEKVGVS